MLQVTIPATESYDERRNEFISTKEVTIKLEHSLISVSEWESRWEKPFLGSDKKTVEQQLDYIRCMTITQNIDPMVYRAIPPRILKEINAYIEKSMTATWFSDKNKKHGAPRREIVTSELIYYWMVSLGIPFDPCQKWHLNRLLTLIHVCDAKNAPAKKMSRTDLASRNRELNAARKARLGTRG